MSTLFDRQSVMIALACLWGLLFLYTLFRHKAMGFVVFGLYALASWITLVAVEWIAGDLGLLVVGVALTIGYLFVLANFKEVEAYLGQMRLLSIFKIKELRQKIIITAMFLAIYRIGFHVPLPMINQAEMARAMRGSEEGLLGLISMFSGGSLSQSTIFGLGIMPYISASIIFQLLASVYPPLEKLQKEGESGRKKINE